MNGGWVLAQAESCRLSVTMAWPAATVSAKRRLRRRGAGQLVKPGYLFDHRPRHGLVLGAAEQIDALALQVGRVVDQPVAREILRRAQQAGRIGRRDLRVARVHAGGQGIVQVSDIRKAAGLAGAVIRPAGDDAGAADGGRIGDGELRRHEAARRQAGHRGLAQIDLQRGQGGRFAFRDRRLDGAGDGVDWWREQQAGGEHGVWMADGFMAFPGNGVGRA